MMRKLFRRRAGERQPASLPLGQRIYAIGDVHGRLDLLDRLLASIAADDAGREGAQTTIILLGDLVDRGPDSAAVVETLRLRAAGQAPLRFLAGNHEEMFLAALAGEERALRAFCRFGGRETLLSYGLTATDYERMNYDEIADALARLVPAAHRAFLQGFENAITVGDYMFVHAGVDPAVPLDAQRTASLRWIRQPFLDHAEPLDRLIVHGHTIAPEVEWRAHRIGIDTGAYTTGRLTALGLEGTDRWLLQT